jgi:hypothetical protein
MYIIGAEKLKRIVYVTTKTHGDHHIQGDCKIARVVVAANGPRQIALSF